MSPLIISTEWFLFGIFQGWLYCSIIKVLEHATYAVGRILVRRWRDLNPRAAINDLLPFQGSPFDLLGISPKALPNELYDQGNIRKRRGWDSNPCAPKDKRFSRPPRYDRFDTSPYRTRCFLRSVSCTLLKLISLSPFAERKRYTTKPFLLCQTKFYPISTSV